MTVEGKRVLVTGAAQGIGRGSSNGSPPTAQRLCVADLNAEGAEQVAAGDPREWRRGGLRRRQRG